MTNEQKQVRDWMSSFGQETPEKPTIPSLEVRKLRAKLILEEALETVNSLGFQCSITLETGDFNGVIEMQGELKEPNLVEIADGCEDLKVVTEGTLVACGLVSPSLNTVDKDQPNDPLFNEVMRSNFSKMWTEDELDIYLSDEECKKNQVIKVGDKYIVKNESGKIQKSPSYSPANLQPIIEEMSKT